MRSFLLFNLILLTLSACGVTDVGSTTSSASTVGVPVQHLPAEIRYPLNCEPGAGSTSAATTPIGLVVWTGAQPPTPAVKEAVAKLASDAKLIRIDDLTQVEGEVTVSEFGASVDAMHGIRLRIQPKQPLTAGWHRLQLSALPDQLRAMASCTPVAGGGYFADFRPDSAPALLGYQVCKKDGGRVKVIAKLSEHMPPVADAQALLSVDGAFGSKMACLDAAGPLALPAEKGEVVVGKPSLSDELAVVCEVPAGQGALVFNLDLDALSLKLPPGAKSAKVELAADAFAAAANGCVDVGLVLSEAQ